MDTRLIKPYEISVWEDIFDKSTNRIVENKLAVIGSDTMTGLNKVYDPVFSKKTNGEKTLTFSLKYKYFDPYSGNDNVINPFAALLVNERKIKLKYENKWYEFIIKDHSESTDEFTWTYTCIDAFVLELSKNGYNIVFDSELNNNQGTAKELAKETLKNTDWQLGGVDILKQLVAEPIYKAKLMNTANIINASGTDEVVPTPIVDIYVFYNYVKNQDGKNVQFIIRDENRKYVIDDHNIITDTNFRIITELFYNNETQQFLDENENIIIQLDNQKDGVLVNPIETKFQANRLVYNQLTTYDPVMKRTVSRYITGDREVYKYTDSAYVTSNIVKNYITNGDNFNVLEDGSLQGWDSYTYSDDTRNELNLITFPEIGTGKELADLLTLPYIEGYLKVKFHGNGVNNTIFNAGINNNLYHINSIMQGQKFVFRWRAGAFTFVSNDKLVSTTGLRAVVAKYQINDRNSGHYYRSFTNDDIIINFDTNQLPQDGVDNIIEGGSIQNNEYIIDGVSQNISTKYLYRNEDDDGLYYWDIDTKHFISTTSPDASYLKYYYLTAEARKTVTKADLTDANQHYGIFIYTVDSNEAKDNTYYIQDIQLTQFYSAENEELPIIIGNTPIVSIHEKDYYYLKPTENITAEEVKLYASTDDMMEDLSLSNPIVPLYNTNSEKTLSISVSQSNCFDILQTIAETFECWVDLVVDHNDSGYIQYDTNNKPKKYVYLKEYVGHDNYAGFRYGININSIERTINSDEIVTKLIVNSSQSDYVDTGYISIMDSPSNISGESYILNFDYYYNQGLLNKDESEAYRLDFIERIAELNKNLRQKEKEFNDLSNTLVELQGQRNVYAELLTTAQNNKNKALDTFETLVEMPYDTYRQQHEQLPISEQLTEEENILKTLGELYSNSSIINNYTGLLINANNEYWNVRRKLYGNENYYIKIWVERDSNQIHHIFVDFSEYLKDFSFALKINEQVEESYVVTLNKKFFDIEVAVEDEVYLIFSPVGDYQVSIPECYVNDNIVLTNKITSSISRTGLNDEINQLIEEKNNIINDFENKYRRFIQEGTWSSTDYIDSDRYYLDAVQVSNTSAQPIVSYNIDAVEISHLEDFNDYIFDVGDKTYIEDTEFFGWHVDNIGTNEEPIWVNTPAREEVIVSEIEWHLNNPENNTITVQNYKTRFEDLFQRISAAVQTVQYNEATYAKISTLLDADGTINQNVLLQSLNNIGGKTYNLTSNGAILIDGDNILIRNLTNTSNLVKINSEGLKVSSDGGQTWATAIDGQGINIGTVYTGLLNTNSVIIGNRENPSFRWDKSGISAYKTKEPTRASGPSYDLQTFVRFDQYGLYGIENNGSFIASSVEDVKKKAHFAITWDGFFIKNNYKGGGRVEITSTDDFRVLKDIDNNGHETEVIKIGALEWNGSEEVDKTTAPTLYGIRIKGKNGIGNAFKADDQGNLEVTGTINAKDGTFDGLVQVGTGNPYIAIDGEEAEIRSSNYSSGAGIGWMINKEGDAVFNNITARGAIKTAVFEYAEIQAVGGIFIFRPSSVIKSARIGDPIKGENSTDLILEVEKPLLFEKISYNKIEEPSGNPQGWYEKTNYGYQLTEDIEIISEKEYFIKDEITNGSWCKISNYISDNEFADSTIQNILLTNGLSYIYKVININNATKEVTLENGAQFITAVKQIGQTDQDVLLELEGGALVDMGREDGTTNYGIGVNSSDNTVNLPARAISLFETTIIPNAEDNIRITYDYQAILGTLPRLQFEGEGAKVNELYHNYLENTQGLYTDNIYLGDTNQYLTFYTDTSDPLNPQKKLKIRANKIEYEANNGDYIDVSDPQTRYIWFDGGGSNRPGGAHAASGIEGEEFDTEDESTYGYNSLMSSDKLALRYNNKDLVYLNDEGLNIKDNLGNVIATYGETIQIGRDTDPIRIEINQEGLSFRNAAGTEVSYLKSNKLFIPYSVVLNEMVVGNRSNKEDSEYIYRLTKDEVIVPNKKYYIYNNGEYIEVDLETIQGSPAAEGWYEIDNSDLWAWSVTDDEHLRLVWKASELKD